MHDALLEALARVPDGAKAEIVRGEIVMMSPTGDLPGRAAFNIALALRRHEGRTPGRAFGDNVGFVVDRPARRSFSPDAAWYTGPPGGMRFLRAAPAFAAEVRSEGDYGRRAERAMAAKRADYFAAGTLVVWDVDLLGDDTVRVHRASAPDTPDVFRRGDVADAEPAVPGWRLPVDELFA